ncbi:MAG TPA: imidazole glycerol phosphate synthase subunit HisH [Syntrophomonadaceae bacterium]|nr:imidazole glycerol phosphate synthase subunit HisH [Syntrophomonadaceae bacterium]HPR92891.1 imidazole glycerol phosphate synthase subunit HisH [Syntrophomonadaceae bacterium]
MLVIIDYGAGNLASVRNAFIKIGINAVISSNKKEIAQADRVVLPGVGAFGDAMNSLQRLDLDGTIKELINSGTPLLGICLGMQLLLTRGEEHGIHSGLDLIKGRVIRFELPREYKVPHMGWNQIYPRQDSRLLKDIPGGSHFYFVHSYFAEPENESVIAARSEYGIDFACAMEQDNLFATQFHPEKSGDIGLKILHNFAAL